MSTSSTTRSIGDYVSYRRNGVCRISDITTENFGRQGKKQYYVLTSVYDKNIRVFVPIGSEIEKEMKTLPTKADIDGFISGSKTTAIEWKEDSKSRAAYFDSIMTGGDRTAIVALLNTLRSYREKLEKTGKTLKANDSKFLSAAETLISGEFGFVLGIQRTEVTGYIDSLI